jgi:hypothetical protein
MGRNSNHPPKGAMVETTYDGLEDLLRAFGDGSISFLVVVGQPGLGKSQRVRDALKNQVTLLIKGRKSALDFYTDLYTHKDLPVILDDADDLMSQRGCLEYVKLLTETDQFKRLDYGTKTKSLEKEGVGSGPGKGHVFGLGLGRASPSLVSFKNAHIWYVSFSVYLQRLPSLGDNSSVVLRSSFQGLSPRFGTGLSVRR